MEPHATQTRSGAPAARILAVLALVAAAIVVVALVAGSLGGSGGGSKTSTRAGSPSGPHDKYYVVEPGDTLGGIAAKEGVPVQRLQQLNPNLDPQLLPEKGCVDLVPDGCKILANGG
jgi:LysM repeat protein